MSEKKRNILSLAILIALLSGLLWIGILLGRSAEQRRVRAYLAELPTTAQQTTNAQLEQLAADILAMEQYMANSDKMMQTILSIRNAYVDPISLDSIYEVAIPKLLAELDPHSEYIPAKSFQQVNESLEGEFDGIGIVFNAMTDTITVLNVIPQGPSDKAGVRAGDRVILIDGREVAGQKLAQDSMVRLMRGPRGSNVKLSVKRGGIDNLVDIDITRAPIELHSIETAFMLDDEAKIGFIRLSQFSRTSHSEMRQAIDKLRGEGAKALIVDLRGNSGGFLDQAILIADEFLPAKRLIVYTEDRNGYQQREFSTGRGHSTDMALAVLVDETSASSSEILAGAMQDNDRGTIIGRRTFGKGLVQTQIPFADGSAIRLTVARYYTPTGRSIQKPYTPGDEMSYHMDIINRYVNNELFSADSIHFADSLKFTTPGGRTVYGGGGIMPDIFIPIDTVGMTKYYNEVWNSNVLYRYTLDFTDRHRADIDAVESLAQLDSLLSAHNLLDDFTRYAERNGIPTNRAELATSRRIIEAQLRAYIGRNALDNESGFYYNIYPIDDAMQRAVAELREELKRNKQ
ncbi:MAG: PDZ domain-containing protein [Alistipes sp.]|nr:PDZ domain-containing protein [Alistipes sp.]